MVIIKSSDGKRTFFERRKNGKPEGFGWHTKDSAKELKRKGFILIPVHKPKK